jgi:hypothetical protein
MNAEDFNIDLNDWTTTTTAKQLKEALGTYMVNTIKAESSPRSKTSNVQDLGIFRIQKVNNGYYIQIGIQEGYHTESAYVCTDADEIGAIITAHIVSRALEK